MLTFELSKDIDVAFSEVQAKVNQVLRQLPDDADPPVVLKVEVGASAVMWLSLQGDRTTQQLNQYARQVIKKRLETIDGVGQVYHRRRAATDDPGRRGPERMAALGVTAQDIRNAFRAEHVQMPGGFLVSGPNENLIKLDLEFHSPEALGEMIVRYADGSPIRLRDIGKVEDAPRRRPRGAALRRQAGRRHRHREGEQLQHGAARGRRPPPSRERDHCRSCRPA